MWQAFRHPHSTPSPPACHSQPKAAGPDLNTGRAREVLGTGGSGRGRTTASAGDAGACGARALGKEVLPEKPGLVIFSILFLTHSLSLSLRYQGLQGNQQGLEAHQHPA